MFSGIDMQLFSSAQQDDGLSFIKPYTTIQLSTQSCGTYPILASTGFYWIPRFSLGKFITVLTIIGSSPYWSLSFSANNNAFQRNFLFWLLSFHPRLHTRIAGHQQGWKDEGLRYSSVLILHYVIRQEGRKQWCYPPALEPQRHVLIVPEEPSRLHGFPLQQIQWTPEGTWYFPFLPSTLRLCNGKHWC